jgi:hypothetical protein
VTDRRIGRPRCRSIQTTIGRINNSQKTVDKTIFTALVSIERNCPPPFQKVPAVEFQDLVNYYTLAIDVAKQLYPVKWFFMESLAKTLAFKHKQNVTWAYRKYKRKTSEGLTALVIEAPRKDQPPLIASFGANPIRFDPRAIISDQKTTIWLGHSEVVQRLLAERCELCSSTNNIEVHHIHKLKDIADRYRERPDPPDWVVRHLQLRRKTLVVCADCLRRIHAGVYDGGKLKEGPLESRVTR